MDLCRDFDSRFRALEVHIPFGRLIGIGESERIHTHAHTPARLKSLSDEAELRFAITLVTYSPVAISPSSQPIYAPQLERANTLTKRFLLRKVAR